jgi:transcriptional regulator with XRE-family HTH domain
MMQKDHIISDILKGGECIKLAEIRKAHGLSQYALSELSGVSRVTIARIESGTYNPTLQTLEALAAALGVSVGELIDRKAG